MTPLERAALAISKVPVNCDGVDIALGDTLDQDELMAAARAVLQALQNQGEAMASDAATILAHERGHPLTRFDLADAWSVMIDTALEEGIEP